MLCLFLFQTRLHWKMILIQNRTKTNHSSSNNTKVLLPPCHGKWRHNSFVHHKAQKKTYRYTVEQKQCPTLCKHITSLLMYTRLYSLMFHKGETKILWKTLWSVFIWSSIVKRIWQWHDVAIISFVLISYKFIKFNLMKTCKKFFYCCHLQ